MLQKKVAEYFESHPKENIVYSALGVLFPADQKERAQKYLGGVSGRTIVVHTRDGVQHEKISDELTYKIAEQENKVNDKQLEYENAVPRDKEKAMSSWKAEQEVLAQLNTQLKKQLAVEQKDELIERSQKEMNTTKVVTKESVEAEIKAQEILISATEGVISNKETKPKKKKDAEAFLKKQIAKLEDLKKKLAGFEPKIEEVVVEPGTTEEVKVEEPVIVEPVVTEEVKVEEPVIVKEKPNSKKEEEKGKSKKDDKKKSGKAANS